DRVWFDGVCGSAVRCVPIGAEESSILGLVFKCKQVGAAWCVTPEQGAGVPGKKEGEGRTGENAWWFTGLGPCDAPAQGGERSAGAPTKTIQRLADSFCKAREKEQGGPEGVKRWYSLGVVRPSRLLPMVNAVMPLPDGWGSALSRIETMKWKTWVNGEGDVE